MFNVVIFYSHIHKFLNTHTKFIFSKYLNFPYYETISFVQKMQLMKLIVPLLAQAKVDANSQLALTFKKKILTKLIHNTKFEITNL